MCGIAGVSGLPQNKKLIKDMIEIMAHRGPDSCGFFYSDQVHLGHCRLSINDISENAAQPFIRDDKNLAVVVNGEIYNFLDIKADLLEKGYSFRSQSDTEVVFHGYQEYGKALFEKLNGMFAIAIWDGKAKELVLSRDRLGIKPLYYSFQSEKSCFTFGSELKAVAQNEMVPLDMDPQSFSEYLMFENYFSNRTLNKTIKMVAPGEYLVFSVSENTLKRCQFWAPSFETCFRTDQTVFSDYGDILNRSVNRHLLSDVPIGFYLSAGFDSSSVVCCASEKLGPNIETYTGFFGMQGYYDESMDAKKTAEHFGCKNTRVTITPDAFENEIEKILWHLDEPRVGMGAFSQYMVAQRASKDVKVILTGHGGDEFFAGYPVFKAILGRKTPFSLLRHSSMREMMYAAYFLLSPLVKKESGFFLPNIFSFSRLDSVLKKEWYQGVKSTVDPLKELRRLQVTCSDEYEQLVMTYLKFYLPALFNVEDKISMAFSLESRTPLCDNEMVDFALSVPLDKKLANLELKHIPKTAMKGRLPDFLYDLPKRGFPTPLAQWFKGPLQSFVRDYVMDHYDYIDMFKKSEVEALLFRGQNSRFNTPLNEIPAHRIWILLNLIIYFKHQSCRYRRYA